MCGWGGEEGIDLGREEKSIGMRRRGLYGKKGKNRRDGRGYWEEQKKRRREEE
jgi:hypothetical protein